MTLTYSPRPTNRVIVTPTIELAWERIEKSHNDRGQFVVVTGRAGAGKTTGMLYLHGEINRDCDAGVNGSFRSIYYVSTDIRHVHPASCERRVLADLLAFGLDLPTVKGTRELRAGALFQTILTVLRQRRIEMVFIDEAGQIPVQGLNVLVNLMNTAAVQFSWPLTIVLIGMDDLPLEVMKLPQVDRRTENTIWFGPCTVNMALEVLQEVHPFFRELDPTSEEGEETMSFLLSDEISAGGMLGRIIQLVQRVARFCEETRNPMSLHELRTVHAMEFVDRAKAIREARAGYRDLNAADKAGRRGGAGGQDTARGRPLSATAARRRSRALPAEGGQ